MNHLSGILEAVEKAEDIQFRFNYHDTEWKDEALYKHEHLLNKIRHKWNLEGECSICMNIFQAMINPEPCPFCGSSLGIRSTYFC